MIIVLFKVLFNLGTILLLGI